MWAASENHLSVCRRKPDMLENIWYAACPEEEKNATVANTKMRCSFPPSPSSDKCECAAQTAGDV